MSQNDNPSSNAPSSVDVDVSDLGGQAAPASHAGPAQQQVNIDMIARTVASAVAQTFASMPQFANQQKAQAAAPAQPAQPAQPKPNISDRGGASPTDHRDSDGVLNSRPFEMTGHDVDDLIVRHGEGKGLQMFQDRIYAALKRVKIVPPSRGGR
jgi:hypothetical protein